MPLRQTTRNKSGQSTTLITGAGVIGCHTARLLAARGGRVLLLDLSPARDAINTIVKDPLVSVVQCDVTDFHALRELVSTRQVTEIVHTAALLSTAIRKDILAGVRVNVMGATNVLEVARQLGVERVVLASSTIVGYPAFGDLKGEFFPEDFPLKSVANRPDSIYAATKVTVEHLGLLYRDLYGVSTVSLRYAAVISAWSGPGTSVPGRVLSMLVAAARTGEAAVISDPFMVWLGSDEFIDARDCAYANVAALDAAAPRHSAAGWQWRGNGRHLRIRDAVRTVSRNLSRGKCIFGRRSSRPAIPRSINGRFTSAQLPGMIPLGSVAQ